MNSKSYLVLLASVLFALSSARAEHMSSESFNPKINTWAEGIILSLDADAGKFSIRGAKKAYSSAYARMMQDIDAKTAKLAQPERDAKAAEIRKEWQDKLLAASREAPGADGDFSFSLPTNPETASVYDERTRYGAELKREGDAPAQILLTPSETLALKTLKDFKVGDAVMVGYESGIIYNTAWGIVRIASRMRETVAAEDRRVVDQRTDAKGTATDRDVEITRAIRKAIFADDSLSVSAHNVNIQTVNGSVVLKGQVKSDAERANVEAKAASVVGVQNVTCQVDVASK